MNSVINQKNIEKVYVLYKALLGVENIVMNKGNILSFIV